MVAVFSDKKEFIFKAVADMYTDVAMHPGKTFHFPTGRLACLFVGYPGEQLDLLPATAPESFAGVGEPIEGNAEELPLPDAFVDVAASNGVFTPVPGKPRAFAEITRVLKPGGRL